jgi:hypothetical protein
LEVIAVARFWEAVYWSFREVRTVPPAPAATKLDFLEMRSLMVVWTFVVRSWTGEVRPRASDWLRSPDDLTVETPELMVEMRSVEADSTDEGSPPL